MWMLNAKRNEYMHLHQGKIVIVVEPKGNQGRHHRQGDGSTFGSPNVMT